MSPNEKDQHINDKNLQKGPRITLDQIKKKIVGEFYFTAEHGVLGESEMGTKPNINFNMDQILFCVLVLRNGARVVGVNYGGVSRDNYDLKLAKQTAYNQALDKIWELEGYRLRDLIHQQNG